jgi:hypothetical protein
MLEEAKPGVGGCSEQHVGGQQGSQLLALRVASQMPQHETTTSVLDGRIAAGSITAAVMITAVRSTEYSDGCL